MAGTTSFSITLTKSCFSGTHLCKNKINAIFFTIQTKINVMDSPYFPIILCHINLWFPGGSSGKEPTFQGRRHKRRGFDPWVGKIPWRRAWQSTPVCLPRESHGQRSLSGYHPWVTKSWTQLEQLCTHARIEPLLLTGVLPDAPHLVTH